MHYFVDTGTCRNVGLHLHLWLYSHTCKIIHNIFCIICAICYPIYWSCLQCIFHMSSDVVCQITLIFNLFTCVFLIEGSSTGIKYEEVCYGRYLSFPFDYTPPRYNGPLYFTPSNGGSRKLLMDKGEVSSFWCYNSHYQPISLWHPCMARRVIWQMSSVQVRANQVLNETEQNLLSVLNKCICVVVSGKGSTHQIFLQLSSFDRFDWKRWRNFFHLIWSYR